MSLEKDFPRGRFGGLSRAEFRRLEAVKNNPKYNQLSEWLDEKELNHLRFMAHRHNLTVAEPNTQPTGDPDRSGFEPIEKERALRQVAIINNFRQVIGEEMSSSSLVDATYLSSDTVVRTFSSNRDGVETVWKYHVGGKLDGFMHVTRTSDAEKSQGKFYRDGSFTYTPPQSWGFDEPIHVANDETISASAPVLKYAATLVMDFLNAYGNAQRQMA